MWGAVTGRVAGRVAGRFAGRVAGGGQPEGSKLVGAIVLTLTFLKWYNPRLKNMMLREVVNMR